MKSILVKKDLDLKISEALGYTYSMMEGEMAHE